MDEIQRVGVVIKSHAPGVERVLEEVVGYLEGRGVECVLEEAAAEKLGRKEGAPREKVPDKVNLVVVLGGDGTLLSIAHLAARKGVPVMGINMGALGFLTEVPLAETRLTLEAYLAGDEKIVNRRRMLEAVHKGKTYHCLNDVVINKGAMARMIQCEVWIDGKKIATTRSDGLILSTPTGSTAYSLSAGGPVLYPNIPAFILTPICPHTLSFRPMVISHESLIKIRLLTGEEEVYLTIDGQRGARLHRGEEVEIRSSPYKLQLISSPKRNFFDLLKEKLRWG